MDNKQSAKAMLAAMMAGTVTKETELMRAKTTGAVDPRVAAQVINESNLPSATELNFKQVAGSNGTLQMVEVGSVADAKGYNSVDPEAILGLIGGKKPNVIKEELRQKQQSSPSATKQVAPIFDIREEMKRRSQGIKGTTTKLTEAVLPSSQPSGQLPTNTSDFVDLVENCVYDILGSMVGVVNENLKDKETIKARIEEAVTFLKLTKALKG